MSFATAVPRPLAVLLATLTVLFAALVATVAPSVAAASDISGSAYYDTNRDATQQPGEAPLVGKRIYLFDAAGAYLKNVPDRPARAAMPSRGWPTRATRCATARSIGGICGTTGCRRRPAASVRT